MTRFEEVQKAYENKQERDFSEAELFDERLEEKAAELAAEAITAVRDIFDDAGFNPDDMSINISDNMADALEKAAANLISIKMERV